MSIKGLSNSNLNAAQEAEEIKPICQVFLFALERYALKKLLKMYS